MKLAEPKMSMRGWGRIRIASTKLSNFAKMRDMEQKLFAHFKGSEPCMWEVTVRFPAKGTVPRSDEEKSA